MVDLEKKDIRSLKKLAWTLCSEYIRRRDGGICFTCGSIRNWKETHAGHFIHGHTKATWLMPENLHCQDPRCNLFLSGNLREYTLRMIDKYGRKKVNDLDKLSKVEHVFNRKELIKWIHYYQKRLEEINQLS